MNKAIVLQLMVLACLPLWLLLPAASLPAQPFQRRLEPFVVESEQGGAMGNAFSGGLYQPRVGLRDLNADRIPDLFLLNPDNVLRLYRNYGDFIFRRVLPSPYDSLPVRRWFRFADIDGDSDDDLFSHGETSEVMLYRNTGTQSAPQFSPNADTMHGADGNVVYTQQETVPSFVDIDADGDLDLFYGKVDGSIIFYENTGTAQSPTLTFRTDSYMNILVIAGRAKPNEGAATQREQQERHGASVLGFADMDGDADLDILFGDFFTERLLLFHNDGTPQQAKFGMNRLDTAFRGIGDDVISAGFNQAEAGDIDADGHQDVLISSLLPNSQSSPLQLFRNTGTNSAPVMRNQQKDPTDEIDVGEYAAPTIIKDSQRNGVLVGSLEGTLTYYETREESGATVWRKKGTFGVPGWQRTAPATGDLDGDGVAEVVIGGVVDDPTKMISIWRFQGNRLVFSESLADVSGINTNVSPSLGDLDGDGDLDLLLGAQNGQAFYFQNIGTATTPAFERASPPPPLDALNAGRDSAPRLVDIDSDGKIDLLVGNAAGFGATSGRQRDGIQFYFNTSDGSFQKRPDFPDMDLPDRSNPTPMIFRDRKGAWLILGMEAGGLQAYYQQGSLEAPAAPEAANLYLTVQPNLLHGEAAVMVQWSSEAPSGQLRVVDLLGREWYRQEIVGRAGNARIVLPKLPAGMYVCCMATGANVAAAPLMLIR
ncbi:MAG: VCBS repeat-containing protein [Armatimonadetes bacterium]|nr:VCBS repeat-containing protein [Armatimonadota bacterium]